MKIQTFITFEVVTNKPFDDRLTVPNLSSLHPVGRRYPGLIFFVESENGPYIYLNDLNNPVPLNTVISGDNQFGLIYEEVSFSQLETALNDITIGVGGIVTVFPLGVSFIKTTSGYKYHSGKYTLTQNQWDTLSDNLKQALAEVIIDSDNYIIDSNLELSDIVITAPTIPINPEEKRYYNVGGVLYYCINNNLWRLGNSTYLITNLTLNIGETEVEHNLNSTYVNCNLWINNFKKVNNVDFITVDENSIKINSRMLVNNVTLIIQTI